MNDPAAIAVRNALVERDKWRAKAEALELERAGFIEHIAQLQRQIHGSAGRADDDYAFQDLDEPGGRAKSLAED